MITKLEMFIALAREQHFGRAAESLGVTQPTLSAAIRQLEDQLSVTLVSRGSRYGGLTPEGERALTWARQIVGDARQMRDEMRFMREGLSGHIRLGVIPTALSWTSRLVSAFRARHPLVRFSVISRNSVDILQMLQDLSLDAGLSYLDNEPVGRVSTALLYRENYALICPAGHALSGRDSIGWEDLRELGDTPLCLLGADMQNRRIISRHLVEVGGQTEPVVETNSTMLMIAQVEQGGLATILPIEMARMLCRGGPLRPVPIRGGQGHSVGLVTRWREPQPPILQALLTEVQRLGQKATPD